jgi:hypothetical protein
VIYDELDAMGNLLNIGCTYFDVNWRDIDGEEAVEAMIRL